MSELPAGEAELIEILERIELWYHSQKRIDAAPWIYEIQAALASRGREIQTTIDTKEETR